MIHNDTFLSLCMSCCSDLHVASVCYVMQRNVRITTLNAEQTLDIRQKCVLRIRLSTILVLFCAADVVSDRHQL